MEKPSKLKVEISKYGIKAEAGVSVVEEVLTIKIVSNDRKKYFSSNRRDER